jgi:hypothetical protein
MTLAAHPVYATDTAGNALSGAKVEMRRWLGNALATLYADPAGSSSLGSQATTDADGYKLVYVPPGRYNRRVFTGSSEAPTTEQTDVVEVALGSPITGLSPQGDWDAITTFSINDMVNHADGGATYTFVSIVDDNLNNEPDVATPASTASWMLLPTTAGADGVEGYLQAFSTATADADPGPGTFRLNHATIASATAAYLDNLEQGGGDISAEIDTWDDSTSTIRGRLILRSTATPGTFAAFDVTGSITDGSGYRKATIAHVAGNGSFAAAAVFAIQFIPKGDKGDTGATGSTGAAGADGADGTDPGILQVFDGASQADGDPSPGKFRLNNATVASATEGYFDNLENGGGDVAGWLDTWDDSTNTVRGQAILRDTTDPTIFAVFDVTGTVVDGTGYRKVTLAYVAPVGGVAFTDARVFSVQFSRAGNKGADGAGTGDMEVATYDPATIAEQLVGLTATQTLTNKTLTQPTLVLKQGAGPTPTAEGDLQWDTDDDKLMVGDGAGQKAFSDDSKVALLGVEGQALTGGFAVTAKDLGTVTTGTLTLDAGDRAHQKYVNNGAHTLAPGTVKGSGRILITNDASAGAITLSGWTVTGGDAFTTTDTHKFLCGFDVTDVGSYLNVKAMQ